VSRPPRRRHVPDTDASLGWLGLVFLAILAAMGFAMLEAATIPQGFAP
jgi:hypothetical protein